MITLLPDCLAQIVVCKWLEAVSVMHLDWAYCVRGGNEDLLKLLKGQVFTRVEICDDLLVLWMIQRNIYCKDISKVPHPSKKYEDLVIEFITSAAASFRSVHASGLRCNKVFHTVLQQCPALIQFRCDELDTVQLTSLLANNSGTLETLDVIALYSFPRKNDQ